MKRTYQSHKFNNRCEYIIDFQKEASTKDRFYMGKMITPTITALDNSGVTNYQNFYQLFKRIGIKSKEIIVIINEFKDYINSFEQNQKINWIKPRELNKSNYGEKNIILNRLALEYPRELINFIYSYLSRFNPCLTNGIFIHELKILVDEIEKQKSLNNFLNHFVSNPAI